MQSKRVHAYIKVEMDRLNDNLLSPLPLIFAPLNTRSIIAELPDINQTETWLTHNQRLNSPHFSDHQVIARSDHVTGNSIGGVMIAVQNTVQVSEVTNFPLNNILIEVTTATLTLLDHKQLQVTLVYQLPSI